MSKPLKPFLKTEQVLMTKQERIEYLEDLIERGKGLSDTEIVAFYGDYTPREPRGTSKTAKDEGYYKKSLERITNHEPLLRLI